MDRQTVILQLEDNCHVLLISDNRGSFRYFGFADHFGEYNFRRAKFIRKISQLSNNMLPGNSVLVVT